MSAFTWRDGDRTIVYGEEAVSALRRQGWDSGLTLLTTPRADPGIMPALMVAEGQVPDLAARLLPEAVGGRLLAWGGGRVIDTAKAIASVTGAQVGAVPTTLSGAEMTSLHRKIQGRDQGPSVRPVLVIGDPALMCSLPEPALRASALNALAHGVEALYGPRANPVATIVALRGAQLIAEGDRALGALLCAYAVDSAGYAVHHVLSQTTVRVAGTGHAQTNAAVLPATITVMLKRAPEVMADLATALGVSAGDLVARVDELGGHARIDLEAPTREAVADAALRRPQLADTPGPDITRAELLAMLAMAAAG
ncbi:MAG: iron-containing alcohol dehydrogenase [Gaiellales bacterium]